MTLKIFSFVRFPFVTSDVPDDKVCMYEEMMTNDDNVESSLLTSSFIENTWSVQVLLQVAHVELEI